MGEYAMERFVRRENVKHLRDMLNVAKGDAERRHLKQLLDEEIQKQIEAGDFTKDMDHQTS
jgi:hypothetical protein